MVFARSSVAVAAAMSDSASSPSTGKRTTPAETDTIRPATAGRAAIPSWTRRATIAACRARRDQDELVATDPPDRVDEPDRLGQHGRDASQDVVADLVAVGRVGGAEVVDIEEGERHFGPLPAGAGQLQLQDASDRPLIGDPGQRVRVGHALEPLRALRRGRP